MHHKKPANFFAVLFLVASASLFAGCANNSVPHADHALGMVQLSDTSWADLSDVREIAFKDSRLTDPNSPFSITLIHRGTADNSFNFSFTDQASAFAAWKRLVSYLGGSLKDSDWKASSQAAEGPAVAPPPEGKAEQSEAYSNLRLDLNALTACRDEKLITPAEYEQGHDRVLNSFLFVEKQGGVYRSVSGQMQSELVQLELLQKDHLVNDEQAADLHKAILIRRSLAPQ